MSNNSNEVGQIINMIDNLQKSMEERFDEVDKKFNEVDKKFTEMNKRFDTVETAIGELNKNQIKILNSIKLLTHDIENNKKHIERLEERESYL